MSLFNIPTPQDQANNLNSHNGALAVGSDGTVMSADQARSTADSSPSYTATMSDRVLGNY